MSNEELFTATALASWKQVIARIDALVAPLSDEQFERHVSPGRNRFRYLIGHLTAVHDKLLPSLGLGGRLHPELDAPYLKHPDGALPDPISTDALKEAWLDVNNAVTTALEKLEPKEWLERHTAISTENFAKEPLRNRLAMVLSRTTHAGFHAGQMVLTR